jgi:hypothetical protein
MRPMGSGVEWVSCNRFSHFTVTMRPPHVGTMCRLERTGGGILDEE